MCVYIYNIYIYIICICVYIYIYYIYILYTHTHTDSTGTSGIYILNELLLLVVDTISSSSADINNKSFVFTWFNDDMKSDKHYWNMYESRAPIRNVTDRRRRTEFSMITHLCWTLFSIKYLILCTSKTVVYWFNTSNLDRLILFFIEVSSLTLVPS